MRISDWSSDVCSSYLFDERLPNPGLFDHVLVRARIDGKQYWMDGTLPPVAIPALDPVIDYRWVLPLSARGSNLEKREWRPAERPDENGRAACREREGKSV